MFATRASFLLVLSVMMSTLIVTGQDSATGAIRGTVLDSSGSRIAQASVVAVNLATGKRYPATSDEEGRFSLDLLPPGDYSARATAQGMSPQVTPQLHVDVGGAAELEFRLAIAGAQEKVTVSAAPALVETKPSAVSTLLDERAMNDFPLNGLRFSYLTLFSPGVTQDPRGLTSATNGDLSFGGIRGFQNTFLVDGADNNNAFFAQARGRYRAPYQFSTEVVQEFRISSNAYGAEQGRSGGAVVNVVTKSGSNHVHGTAFYYFRDSSFGATNPFLAFKPHNRQQQIGGTIGGPLKRNKVFFFAGFDQHIFHVPNVVQFLDGSSQVVPRAGTGPYTPGDYEATDQALVFAAAAQLTSLAGEYPAAQVPTICLHAFGYTSAQSMKTSSISRRQFLGAASAAAALPIVPASLRAAAMTLGEDSATALHFSTVHISSSAPPILFDPDKALGSSMDILSHDVVEKIYTEPMVKQCLSAGWGPITYRQNTELSIGAWHWNPNGTWSDAKNKRGYFTGTTELKEPIRHSYGYPLPHRGHTRNGGAEHGYSRLTDGDPDTYWKSNPYLAGKFTGEPDSAHPQWVVLDLGSHEPVSHVRIDWVDPYARSYEVQYWTAERTTTEKSVAEAGGEDPMGRPTSGVWTTFPNGTISNAKGGTATLQLTSVPILVRHLRIWMTESSNTADSRPSATHDSKDPRSSVGYAIRELYVGTLTPAGDFVDLVQHRADQNQTATLCSSIDPWHSDSDLNDHGDQTGLDLFFTSGITNKLPAMIPISLLYGTPDDASAQMEYLKKRGYAISYVEMGEEPDGQYMLPEDYGALYLQFATAMHRVDPTLKLGGPVFEGVNEDIKVWPDAQGRTSWLGRFLDYLKAHNRLSDLAFMSFEHYPFPPCEIVWADLFREPELTRHILDVWRQDGLPSDVPMMNTESNVTYGNAEQMADIFAALWLSDSVGAFLTAGGAVYYHSPIQPEPLSPGCRGFGTYGNYVADSNLNIKTFTSQYHASRLINLEWVQHRAGVHKLHPATCDLKDAAGHTLITAYAVTRPDGDCSLMLINKDQTNPHEIRIAFDDPPASFAGAISLVTFGSDQYMWKSDGPSSHPDPDNPPVRRTLPAGTQTITLPKASVTVLRGKVIG